MRLSNKLDMLLEKHSSQYLIDMESNWGLQVRQQRGLMLPWQKERRIIVIQGNAIQNSSERTASR
jgi:hypothetical protein